MRLKGIQISLKTFLSRVMVFRTSYVGYPFGIMVLYAVFDNPF